MAEFEEVCSCGGALIWWDAGGGGEPLVVSSHLDRDAVEVTEEWRNFEGAGDPLLLGLIRDWADRVHVTSPPFPDRPPPGAIWEECPRCDGRIGWYFDAPRQQVVVRHDWGDDLPSSTVERRWDARAEVDAPSVARRIREWLVEVHGDRREGAAMPGGNPAMDLNALRVCVTGKVEGYTRDQLAAALARAGGSLDERVDLGTDYLVIGERPGATKLRDARRLGTATRDADWLTASLEYSAQRRRRDREATPRAVARPVAAAGNFREDAANARARGWEGMVGFGGDRTVLPIPPDATVEYRTGGKPRVTVGGVLVGYATTDAPAPPAPAPPGTPSREEIARLQARGVYTYGTPQPAPAPPGTRPADPLAAARRRRGEREW